MCRCISHSLVVNFCLLPLDPHNTKRISVREKNYLTYTCINVFQDFLYGAVLPDQVDGSLGTDSLDGAAVVTPQQNTKVYELEEINTDS